MAPRRKGLGKGLDSMFPSYADNPRQKEKVETEQEQDAMEIDDDQAEEIVNPEKVSKKSSERKKKEVPDNAVVMLKISEVEPNREQPRKTFNEDNLQELSDSIRQYGVIQPLIVQKREDYYEIVAGERRWRAAKMAGKKEIPVLIQDYTEQQIMEISLIENIQREDLNPIEEALAYERLLNEFNLKQDELAEKVSKSRTTITNAMRLLKLDERVRQMLVDEMLTAGHARALLGITDPQIQYETAQKIFDEKLSVRDVEKLVKKIALSTEKGSNEEKPVEKDQALDLICKEMEDRMKDILGTKVSVNRRSKQKGRIEIEYYSQEELERIYELLRQLNREV